MTPKEKAFELAHKFRLIDIRTSESTTMMISMADAKQCALIAVDEILKLENNNGYYFDGTNVTSISFWQELKQEIERL